MKPATPIGVFDSGYGGLTVLKEIMATLPDYDYLYLGDNLRAPYGEKTFDEVYEYTLQNVKWLLSKNCALVIIACNTASAKALRTIQQNDLPNLAPEKRVLGIIRPTAEVFGHLSATGHVGILGTRGTVNSESYLIETAKFFPGLVVTQLACPEWVDLVENNLYDKPEADGPVNKYINSVMKKDGRIDTILLACTHYPLLMNKLKKFTPETVQLISQGQIVAGSLKDYLQRHIWLEKQISKNGKRSYFTTGDAKNFDTHASIFLGKEVQSKHINILA